MPSSNWGAMPCSRWPDTNGFVDPITWITTRSPFNLDQQTKQDMLNHAASDSRFGAVIPGTFGKDLNWTPSWELRWMDFNFTRGRTVRIWHATGRSNSSVRYTNFLDPDTGSWTGWKRAF